MTGRTAVQKRIHQAALKLFAVKGSTDVSVSELADAAGVARGTIYNNLESRNDLFHTVAAQMAQEMDQRVVASYAGTNDYASRLAIGIRLYVRRSHEEQHWGRFLLHFGSTTESLQEFWSGPPMQDLMMGLERRRFEFRPEQARAALGIVAGATLSAIALVLQGLRTWRDAGSDAAELALRALGVPVPEAREIACRELPPLADLA